MMIDDRPPVSPICDRCIHYVDGTFVCSAFPQKIPIEIWVGENNHRQAVEGDNGIRFEAKNPAYDF